MHNADHQQQNDKQSHNINNNNEKKIGQQQKNGTKENKFVPKVYCYSGYKLDFGTQIVSYFKQKSFLKLYPGLSLKSYLKNVTLD